MKKLIRKLLKESSGSPKMDYYRKVAKMVVDSIKIDHKKYTITLPFIIPFSSDRITRFIKNGWKQYDIIYDKDYLSVPEFAIYIQKYGIPANRGILMSIPRLIEKGLQKRIDNSSSPLTESKKGKKKFIDIVVDELVGDTILKWEDERGDRSPIHVPWSNNKNRITFNFFIDTLTHPFVWENSIKNYIMITYGVPDEDVESIWVSYKKIMFRKYKKYIETFKGYKNLTEKGWKSLTENVDKKQKYIEYIVDDMVKKTRFRREDRKISFPFHDHGRYKGFYDEFINVHMFKTMETFFYDYLTERYGAIDPLEKYEIWDNYGIEIEDLVYGMKHG